MWRKGLASPPVQNGTLFGGAHLRRVFEDLLGKRPDEIALLEHAAVMRLDGDRRDRPAVAGVDRLVPWWVPGVVVLG